MPPGPLGLEVDQAEQRPGAQRRGPGAPADLGQDGGRPIEITAPLEEAGQIEPVPWLPGLVDADPLLQRDRAGQVTRAFELSQPRLSLGHRVRAGAADRERLEALGVRVADASEFGGGIINHDLFLSNKEVQQVVKRAIERS